VQKLYSEHPAFLTDGTGGNVDPGDSEQLFLPGFLSDRFFCYSFAGSEKLTTSYDVVFASSVCQQAEVTYPYIASGQDMKKEPSDELVSLECHGLLMIVVGIISPEERDIAALDIKDSVIADRDPVSISAEVLKDALGTIEGRLAIDDPLLMVKMSLKGFKGFEFLEVADTSGEYEISRFEAFFQKAKKLAAEQR
jgi:hypothetical protein